MHSNCIATIAGKTQEIAWILFEHFIVFLCILQNDALTLIFFQSIFWIETSHLDIAVKITALLHFHRFDVICRVAGVGIEGAVCQHHSNTNCRVDFMC